MDKKNSIKLMTLNKFIEQVPGYFGIVNLQSRFISLNKTGLRWIGFKNSDEIINLPYYRMRCMAAEMSEFFIHQDDLIKSQDNQMKFLGYYCYANEEWKLTFGEKYILKNDHEEIEGIACHINEITNYNLIDISSLLFKEDNKYFNKNSKQRGYLLSEGFKDIQLSRRESECMFFLLRGKTINKIAKILNLSPRTIEVFINNIKFKLKCTTKSELIEKSIAKGYLNVLPDSLMNCQLKHKIF